MTVSFLFVQGDLLIAFLWSWSNKYIVIGEAKKKTAANATSKKYFLLK